MSNLCIAQSGGPTAAINASLAGVLREFLKDESYNKIFGLRFGITGIFTNEYVALDELFDTEEKIDRLSLTPSMFLGSCRYKLPDVDSDNTIEIADKTYSTREVYEMIFNFFSEHEIKSFFYIGGNDSMDTVLKLSEYAKEYNYDIRICGIPKTIDNDLPLIDHTPGFGSAAKYIASSLLEISHDTSIYRIPSVTIVEIMGRDAGWLTAASALARNEYSSVPDRIYLPEVPFSVDSFVDDVAAVLKEKRNVVVAVSEGIRDRNGRYICESESAHDKFGHVMLSGAGKYLENVIKDTLGVKVRSVEVNILQRVAGHMTSKTDILESEMLGATSYKAAKEGKTGVMSVINRVNPISASSDSEYLVEYSTERIELIANGVRKVPREYINEEGNDVTPLMINYLKPLIQGEVDLSYRDGLPLYQGILKNC
ncbi:MAG: 6-phosphofructokinase [Lachnospiraceae bacterium]|nr:6-phosphofructokinase [Lachnospiraceae bacterium]